MLLLRKGHLGQLENSEYLSLADAERGQLKRHPPCWQIAGSEHGKFRVGLLEEWRSDAATPANEHIPSARSVHDEREECAVDRDKIEIEKKRRRGS